MDGSDSQRLALARGRAADLLAHLFRSGVTVERLAHLRSVHALRPHLPEALDSAAADEAAARHHRATSRQVFPYESVFLDASALLGGDTAAALRDLGARSGRPLGQGEHEADHLSEELQLLSWLCAAEVHALEDGASNALARVRARQHELLDGHLLRWLPALAVALEPVDPLYGAAAELARELAVELHGELVQHGLSEGASAWSLPPADDLLSDPRVGLKAISKRLVTPVLVGGFWSQQRLAELARETGVGAGFAPVEGPELQRARKWLGEAQRPLVIAGLELRARRPRGKRARQEGRAQERLSAARARPGRMAQGVSSGRPARRRA